MNPSVPAGPLALVLIGVTGSGKTTVGQLLAHQLDWPFHDADDFHPPANVRKMAQGIPLTDADRAPWLECLSSHLNALLDEGQSSVLACSALKETYRRVLGGQGNRVWFAFLKGSEELIAGRISQRQHRYMPAGLLKSQFEALEEPQDALVIDIGPAPDVVAAAIRAGLGL